MTDQFSSHSNPTHTMIMKHMLTLSTLWFFFLCTAGTQEMEDTQTREVEKKVDTQEEELGQKVLTIGTSRQGGEVLPRRKRIKRKYAGVGKIREKHSNQATLLLEKDPTFMKVTSARILKADNNNVNGNGRIRNTRRQRRHFGNGRRKNLNNFRNTSKKNQQATMFQRGANMRQGENDANTNSSDNPVMSVITLLD